MTPTPKQETNGKLLGFPPILQSQPLPTVVEAVPPPPDDVAPDTLAEVLSVSQAKCFLTCPARWYFKYLIGLPDPPTASLGLGTAVHSALGYNFVQKIDSKQDLDIRAVVERFAIAWREQAQIVEFREDEDTGALADTGAAMVVAYMGQLAPTVQPAFVELPVAGAIGGVQVRGFVDVVDIEGRVIDLKTSAKKPAGISPDYRLQLTTYDLLTPQSRGRVALHTMTKQKTVQVIEQSAEIGPADVKFAETLYPMVQDSIRDGIYYPRRDNNYLCSRKNCPFWRACEKEFGGEVEA